MVPTLLKKRRPLFSWPLNRLFNARGEVVAAITGHFSPFPCLGPARMRSPAQWAGLFGCLTGGVLAQFPPTPEGVTTLKSRFDENIAISYKEVRAKSDEIFVGHGRGLGLTRQCISSPDSAKLRLESGRTPATFTSRRVCWRISGRRTIFRLTRSSGSLKHGKTPKMRRLRSGEPGGT